MARQRVLFEIMLGTSAPPRASKLADMLTLKEAKHVDTQ